MNQVKIWQRLFILALLSFLASCGVAPEEKQQQVTLGLQSFSSGPSQAVAGTETIWIRAFWVDADSYAQSMVASALIDTTATTVTLDLPTNTSLVLVKSSYDQVYSEADLNESNPVVLENRISESFKITNSTTNLTIQVAVDSFTLSNDNVSHPYNQSGGTDENDWYDATFTFDRSIDKTGLVFSSDTTCTGNIQLSTAASNFSTCLTVARNESFENSEPKKVSLQYNDATEGLSASTEYSLKFTGLKDTYGTGQAADFIYNFTTAASSGDTGTGTDTTATSGLVSTLDCAVPTTATYKPNMISVPNGGESWAAGELIGVFVNTSELGATGNVINTCILADDLNGLDSLTGQALISSLNGKQAYRLGEGLFDPAIAVDGLGNWNVPNCCNGNGYRVLAVDPTGGFFDFSDANFTMTQ